MLLRRITEHVKAQNWTAVGLDFLIVVVGVFIGIQVANWNDAQGDIREERAILLRLIDEAQQSDRNMGQAIERSGQLAAASMRVHAMLLDGHIAAEDQAILKNDLLQLGPWDKEGHVRATLDQIIASGRISLIRSQPVQDAIAAHRENILAANQAFQNLGSMNLDHTIAMRNSFDVVLTPQGMEVITPMEALVAETELRRRVGQFAFIYREMQAYHEHTRNAHAEYKSVLSDYARERGWLK